MLDVTKKPLELLFIKSGFAEFYIEVLRKQIGYLCLYKKKEDYYFWQNPILL